MKCHPREIIKEVPEVQSVVLPEYWFNELDVKKSVFCSLYEWMLKDGCVPDDDKCSLHNRTYVGEKLFNRLIAAEKTRLKKVLKLKGEELDDAVAFSDINSGPKTEVAGFRISGDVILVVPERSRQAFSNFSRRFSRKQHLSNVEKTKAKAAGATFYQWLLSQIDRPDRVGDLARDAKVDGHFPRENDDFEALTNRLEHTAAYGSFKQAWLEYLVQYPERVKPSAWCSDCGRNIDVGDGSLVWDEAGELSVVDSACLAKYGGDDEIVSLPLKELTPAKLESLAEEHDLYEFDVERWGETLKLWGVWPAENSDGVVYFIRADKTHAIKIGFTAGEVEARLGSLQTAQPFKLEVITCVRGSKDYERALHSRFANHRLEGEWFHPHPDLLAFISTLPKYSKC